MYRIMISDNHCLIIQVERLSQIKFGSIDYYYSFNFVIIDLHNATLSVAKYTYDLKVSPFVSNIAQLV